MHQVVNLKSHLKRDAVLTNSNDSFAPLSQANRFFSDLGQHTKMMSEQVVYDSGWPFQTAASIFSMNWNVKIYLDDNHQRPRKCNEMYSNITNLNIIVS